MTCDQAQGELFAFHFALLTLEERTGVEAHLLDCRSCLQAYLAIKLETETARSEPPATAVSRARLREDVAQELELLPRKAQAWWGNPFAAIVAAAAVTTAVFLVQLAANSAGRMPHALQADQSSSAPATGQ